MSNLKELQKKVKLGTIMAEDSMLKDENQKFIDTGSYALNKIISGLPLGGIPLGRAITFNGVSGVGKSYFTATCMANFQKQHNGDIILFESENAMDEGFYTRLGVDTNKILWLPVSVINEMGLKMINILNTIITNIDTEIADNKDNPKWSLINDSQHYGKYMFVVDSLGNLMSSKEAKDISEGKMVSEMGNRAKNLRAFGRTIIPLLRKTGVTLLSTNHVYVDASGYVPKYIAAGGGGPEYISHTIVFFKKSKLKDGKEIIGNKITASTEKNRLAPPFQSVELELDYTKGLNRLSGLTNMLISANLIEKNGSRYTIIDTDGNKKSLYWKDIEPRLVELGFIDKLNSYFKSEGYYDASKISETKPDQLENDMPENMIQNFIDLNNIVITKTEYNQMSVKEVLSFIEEHPNMKDQIIKWELEGKNRKRILNN